MASFGRLMLEIHSSNLSVDEKDKIRASVKVIVRGGTASTKDFPKSVKGKKQGDWGTKGKLMGIEIKPAGGDDEAAWRNLAGTVQITLNIESKSLGGRTQEIADFSLEDAVNGHVKGKSLRSTPSRAELVVTANVRPPLGIRLEGPRSAGRPSAESKSMDNELADLLAKFDKPIESKPKPEQSSLQAMLGGPREGTDKGQCPSDIWDSVATELNKAGNVYQRSLSSIFGKAGLKVNFAKIQSAARSVLGSQPSFEPLSKPQVRQILDKMWQDGLVERRTPIARSASPPRATAKPESSLSGLLDPGSSKPSATSSSSSERISERKQQSEGKKPDASLAGILSPSAKPTQVAVGDDVWVKKPTETHAMEARVLHVYSDNTADIVYTSVPRLGQRERSVPLEHISRTKPSSRARRSPSPDRSIFASMDATLGGKKEESGQVEESWEPVEGQAVKAHYREGQPWRLGTIVRVNSDRTVDVRYTDDRVVRGLAFSLVRPRDRGARRGSLSGATGGGTLADTLQGDSERKQFEERGQSSESLGKDRGRSGSTAGFGESAEGLAGLLSERKSNAQDDGLQSLLSGSKPQTTTRGESKSGSLASVLGSAADRPRTPPSALGSLLTGQPKSETSLSGTLSGKSPAQRSREDDTSSKLQSLLGEGQKPDAAGGSLSDVLTGRDRESRQSGLSQLLSDDQSQTPREQKLSSVLGEGKAESRGVGDLLAGRGGQESSSLKGLLESSPQHARSGLADVLGGREASSTLESLLSGKDSSTKELQRLLGSDDAAHQRLAKLLGASGRNISVDRLTEILASPSADSTDLRALLGDDPSALKNLLDGRGGQGLRSVLGLDQRQAGSRGVGTHQRSLNTALATLPSQVVEAIEDAFYRHSVKARASEEDTVADASGAPGRGRRLPAEDLTKALRFLGTVVLDTDVQQWLTSSQFRSRYLTLLEFQRAFLDVVAKQHRREFSWSAQRPWSGASAIQGGQPTSVSAIAAQLLIDKCCAECGGFSVPRPGSLQPCTKCFGSGVAGTTKSVVLTQLAAGRSTQVVEAISTIVNSFTAIAQRPEGVVSSASLSKPLAGVPFNAIPLHALPKLLSILRRPRHLARDAAATKELTTRIQKTHEPGVHAEHVGFLEWLSVFGYIAEEADTQASIQELANQVILRNEGSAARTCLETVLGLINKALSHPLNPRYWEEHDVTTKRKIIEVSGGTALLQSCGWSDVWSNRDARRRLALDEAFDTMDHPKQRLPTAVVHRMEACRSDLEVSLQQLDHDIPLVHPAYREAIASVPPREVKPALQVMRKYVSNILQHPEDQRCWRIHGTNSVFCERLGWMLASEQLMQSIGFQRVQASQPRGRVAASGTRRQLYLDSDFTLRGTAPTASSGFTFPTVSKQLLRVLWRRLVEIQDILTNLPSEPSGAQADAKARYSASLTSSRQRSLSPRPYSSRPTRFSRTGTQTPSRRSLSPRQRYGASRSLRSLRSSGTMRAAFRQEGEATRFDTDRMVDQLARAGPAFSPVYSSFGEQDRVLAAVEGALETHGRGQEEVRQQVEGLRTLFDSLDTQGLGMVAVDDLMKLFGTSRQKSTTGGDWCLKHKFAGQSEIYFDEFVQACQPLLFVPRSIRTNVPTAGIGEGSIAASFGLLRWMNPTPLVRNTIDSCRHLLQQLINSPTSTELWHIPSSTFVPSTASTTSTARRPRQVLARSIRSGGSRRGTPLNLAPGQFYRPGMTELLLSVGYRPEPISGGARLLGQSSLKWTSLPRDVSAQLAGALDVLVDREAAQAFAAVPDLNAALGFVGYMSFAMMHASRASVKAFLSSAAAEALTNLAPLGASMDQEKSLVIQDKGHALRISPVHLWRLAFTAFAARKWMVFLKALMTYTGNVLMKPSSSEVRRIDVRAKGFVRSVSSLLLPALLGEQVALEPALEAGEFETGAEFSWRRVDGSMVLHALGWEEASDGTLFLPPSADLSLLRARKAEYAAAFKVFGMVRRTAEQELNRQQRLLSKSGKGSSQQQPTVSTTGQTLRRSEGSADIPPTPITVENAHASTLVATLGPQQSGNLLHAATAATKQAQTEAQALRKEVESLKVQLERERRTKETIAARAASGTPQSGWRHTSQSAWQDEYGHDEPEQGPSPGGPSTFRPRSSRRGTSTSAAVSTAAAGNKPRKSRPLGKGSELQEPASAGTHTVIVRDRSMQVNSMFWQLMYGAIPLQEYPNPSGRKVAAIRDSASSTGTLRQRGSSLSFNRQRGGSNRGLAAAMREESSAVDQSIWWSCGVRVAIGEENMVEEAFITRVRQDLGTNMVVYFDRPLVHDYPSSTKIVPVRTKPATFKAFLQHHLTDWLLHDIVLPAVAESVVQGEQRLHAVHQAKELLHRSAVRETLVAVPLACVELSPPRVGDQACSKPLLAMTSMEDMVAVPPSNENGSLGFLSAPMASMIDVGRYYDLLNRSGDESVALTAFQNPFQQRYPSSTALAWHSFQTLVASSTSIGPGNEETIAAGAQCPSYREVWEALQCCAQNTEQEETLASKNESFGAAPAAIATNTAGSALAEYNQQSLAARRAEWAQRYKYISRPHFLAMFRPLHPLDILLSMDPPPAPAPQVVPTKALEWWEAELKRAVEAAGNLGPEQMNSIVACFATVATMGYAVRLAHSTHPWQHGVSLSGFQVIMALLDGSPFPQNYMIRSLQMESGTLSQAEFVTQGISLVDVVRLRVKRDLDLLRFTRASPSPFPLSDLSAAPPPSSLAASINSEMAGVQSQWEVAGRMLLFSKLHSRVLAGPSLPPMDEMESAAGIGALETLEQTLAPMFRTACNEEWNEVRSAQSLGFMEEDEAYQYRVSVTRLLRVIRRSARGEALLCFPLGATAEGGVITLEKGLIGLAEGLAGGHDPSAASLQRMCWFELRGLLDGNWNYTTPAWQSTAARALYHPFSRNLPSCLPALPSRAAFVASANVLGQGRKDSFVREACMDSASGIVVLGYSDGSIHSFQQGDIDSPVHLLSSYNPSLRGSTATGSEGVPQSWAQLFEQFNDYHVFLGVQDGTGSSPWQQVGTSATASPAAALGAALLNSLGAHAPGTVHRGGGGQVLLNFTAVDGRVEVWDADSGVVTRAFHLCVPAARAARQRWAVPRQSQRAQHRPWWVWDTPSHASKHRQQSWAHDVRQEWGVVVENGTYLSHLNILIAQVRHCSSVFVFDLALGGVAVAELAGHTGLSPLLAVHAGRSVCVTAGRGNASSASLEQELQGHAAGSAEPDGSLRVWDLRGVYWHVQQGRQASMSELVKEEAIGGAPFTSRPGTRHHEVTCTNEGPHHPGMLRIPCARVLLRQCFSNSTPKVLGLLAGGSVAVVGGSNGGIKAVDIRGSRVVRTTAAAAVGDDDYDSLTEVHRNDGMTALSSDVGGNSDWQTVAISAMDLSAAMVPRIVMTETQQKEVIALTQRSPQQTGGVRIGSSHRAGIADIPLPLVDLNKATVGLYYVFSDGSSVSLFFDKLHMFYLNLRDPGCLATLSAATLHHVIGSLEAPTQAPQGSREQEEDWSAAKLSIEILLQKLHMLRRIVLVTPSIRMAQGNRSMWMRASVVGKETVDSTLLRGPAAWKDIALRWASARQWPQLPSLTAPTALVSAALEAAAVGGVGAASGVYGNITSVEVHIFNAEGMQHEDGLEVEDILACGPVPGLPQTQGGEAAGSHAAAVSSPILEYIPGVIMQKKTSFSHFSGGEGQDLLEIKGLSTDITLVLPANACRGLGSSGGGFRVGDTVLAPSMIAAVDMAQLHWTGYTAALDDPSIAHGKVSSSVARALEMGAGVDEKPSWWHEGARHQGPARPSGICVVVTRNTTTNAMRLRTWALQLISMEAPAALLSQPLPRSIREAATAAFHNHLLPLLVQRRLVIQGFAAARAAIGTAVEALRSRVVRGLRSALLRQAHQGTAVSGDNLSELEPFLRGIRGTSTPTLLEYGNSAAERIRLLYGLIDTATLSQGRLLPFLHACIMLAASGGVSFLQCETTVRAAPAAARWVSPPREYQPLWPMVWCSVLKPPGHSTLPRVRVHCMHFLRHVLLSCGVPTTFLSTTPSASQGNEALWFPVSSRVLPSIAVPFAAGSGHHNTWRRRLEMFCDVNIGEGDLSTHDLTWASLEAAVAGTTAGGLASDAVASVLVTVFNRVTPQAANLSEALTNIQQERQRIYHWLENLHYEPKPQAGGASMPAPAEAAPGLLTAHSFAVALRLANPSDGIRVLIKRLQQLQDSARNSDDNSVSLLRRIALSRRFQGLSQGLSKAADKNALRLTVLNRMEHGGPADAWANSSTVEGALIRPGLQLLNGLIETHLLHNSRAGGVPTDPIAVVRDICNGCNALLFAVGSMGTAGDEKLAGKGFFSSEPEDYRHWLQRLQLPEQSSGTALKQCLQQVINQDVLGLLVTLLHVFGTLDQLSPSFLAEEGTAITSLDGGINAAAAMVSRVIASAFQATNTSDFLASQMPYLVNICVAMLQGRVQGDHALPVWAEGLTGLRALRRHPAFVVPIRSPRVVEAAIKLCRTVFGAEGSGSRAFPRLRSFLAGEWLDEDDTGDGAPVSERLVRRLKFTFSGYTAGVSVATIANFMQHAAGAGDGALPDHRDEAQSRDIAYYREMTALAATIQQLKSAIADNRVALFTVATSSLEALFHQQKVVAPTATHGPGSGEAAIARLQLAADFNVLQEVLPALSSTNNEFIAAAISLLYHAVAPLVGGISEATSEEGNEDLPSASLQRRRLCHILGSSAAINLITPLSRKPFVSTHTKHQVVKLCEALWNARLVEDRALLLEQARHSLHSLTHSKHTVTLMTRQAKQDLVEAAQRVVYAVESNEHPVAFQRQSPFVAIHSAVATLRSQAIGVGLGGDVFLSWAEQKRSLSAVLGGWKGFSGLPMGIDEALDAAECLATVCRSVESACEEWKARSPYVMSQRSGGDGAELQQRLYQMQKGIWATVATASSILASLASHPLEHSIGEEKCAAIAHWASRIVRQGLLLLQWACTESNATLVATLSAGEPWDEEWIALRLLVEIIASAETSLSSLAKAQTNSRGMVPCPLGQLHLWRLFPMAVRAVAALFKRIITARRADQDGASMEGRREEDVCLAVESQAFASGLYFVTTAVLRITALALRRYSTKLSPSRATKARRLASHYLLQEGNEAEGEGTGVDTTTGKPRNAASIGGRAPGRLPKAPEDESSMFLSVVLPELLPALNSLMMGAAVVACAYPPAPSHAPESLRGTATSHTAGPPWAQQFEDSKLADTIITHFLPFGLHVAQQQRVKGASRRTKFDLMRLSNNVPLRAMGVTMLWILTLAIKEAQSLEQRGLVNPPTTTAATAASSGWSVVWRALCEAVTTRHLVQVERHRLWEWSDALQQTSVLLVLAAVQLLGHPLPSEELRRIGLMDSAAPIPWQEWVRWKNDTFNLPPSDVSHVLQLRSSQQLPKSMRLQATQAHELATTAPHFEPEAGPQDARSERRQWSNAAVAALRRSSSLSGARGHSSATQRLQQPALQEGQPKAAIPPAPPQHDSGTEEATTSVAAMSQSLLSFLLPAQPPPPRPPKAATVVPSRGLFSMASIPKPFNPDTFTMDNSRLLATLTESKALERSTRPGAPFFQNKQKFDTLVSTLPQRVRVAISFATKHVEAVSAVDLLGMLSHIALEQAQFRVAAGDAVVTLLTYSATGLLGVASASTLQNPQDMPAAIHPLDVGRRFGAEQLEKTGCAVALLDTTRELAVLLLLLINAGDMRNAWLLSEQPEGSQVTATASRGTGTGQSKQPRNSRGLWRRSGEGKVLGSSLPASERERIRQQRIQRLQQRQNSWNSDLRRLLQGRNQRETTALQQILNGDQQQRLQGLQQLLGGAAGHPSLASLLSSNRKGAAGGAAAQGERLSDVLAGSRNQDAGRLSSLLSGEGKSGVADVLEGQGKERGNRSLKQVLGEREQNGGRTLSDVLGGEGKQQGGRALSEVLEPRSSVLSALLEGGEGMSVLRRIVEGDEGMRVEGLSSLLRARGKDGDARLAALLSSNEAESPQPGFLRKVLTGGNEEQIRSIAKLLRASTDASDRRLGLLLFRDTTRQQTLSDLLKGEDSTTETQIREAESRLLSRYRQGDSRATSELSALLGEGAKGGTSIRDLLNGASSRGSTSEKQLAQLLEGTHARDDAEALWGILAGDQQQRLRGLQQLLGDSHGSLRSLLEPARKDSQGDRTSTGQLRDVLAGPSGERGSRLSSLLSGGSREKEGDRTLSDVLGGEGKQQGGRTLSDVLGGEGKQQGGRTLSDVLGGEGKKQGGRTVSEVLEPRSSGLSALLEGSEGMSLLRRIVEGDEGMRVEGLSSLLRARGGYHDVGLAQLLELKVQHEPSELKRLLGSTTPLHEPQSLYDDEEAAGFAREPVQERVFLLRFGVEAVGVLDVWQPSASEPLPHEIKTFETGKSAGYATGAAAVERKTVRIQESQEQRSLGHYHQVLGAPASQQEEVRHTIALAHSTKQAEDSARPPSATTTTTISSRLPAASSIIAKLGGAISLVKQEYQAVAARRETSDGTLPLRALPLVLQRLELLPRAQDKSAKDWTLRAVAPLNLPASLSFSHFLRVLGGLMPLIAERYTIPTWSLNLLSADLQRTARVRPQGPAPAPFSPSMSTTATSGVAEEAYRYLTQDALSETKTLESATVGSGRHALTATAASTSYASLASSLLQSQPSDHGTMMRTAGTMSSLASMTGRLEGDDVARAEQAFHVHTQGGVGDKEGGVAIYDLPYVFRDMGYDIDEQEAQEICAYIGQDTRELLPFPAVTKALQAYRAFQIRFLAANQTAAPPGPAHSTGTLRSLVDTGMSLPSVKEQTGLSAILEGEGESNEEGKSLREQLSGPRGDGSRSRSPEAAAQPTGSSLSEVLGNTRGSSPSAPQQSSSLSDTLQGRGNRETSRRAEERQQPSAPLPSSSSSSLGSLLGKDRPSPRTKSPNKEERKNTPSSLSSLMGEKKSPADSSSRLSPLGKQPLRPLQPLKPRSPPSNRGTSSSSSLGGLLGSKPLSPSSRGTSPLGSRPSPTATRASSPSSSKHTSLLSAIDLTDETPATASRQPSPLRKTPQTSGSGSGLTSLLSPSKPSEPRRSPTRPLSSLVPDSERKARSPSPPTASFNSLRPTSPAGRKPTVSGPTRPTSSFSSGRKPSHAVPTRPSGSPSSRTRPTSSSASGSSSLLDVLK